MIAFIEGILAEHESDAVVVDVGGVGYRVMITRTKHEVGDKVKYFVAEVIREDKHDLYGFETKDERELFYIFTDVQGVGPKMGQKILSAASSDALRKHIQQDDVSFFTSISGVGKKTAQKIILDLKGVLVDTDSTGKTEHSDDVTEALESLGYSADDIRKVMPHVVGATIESKVKCALKMLSR
ncbi:MAG: Holliday junction branch migration protein RuvA [Patescibacteria group bacterium]|jgi:Holliday junction DNA helicase RuvA